MKFYTIILIFIFISCAREKNTEIKKDEKSEPKVIRNEQLLNKFKTIIIDTFYVYSTYENNKFEGVRIEKSEAEIFPEEIIHTYSEIDIFACYKFIIDSTRIGLIARTPSEYSSTSIKLFIYDKKSNSIINYIELAGSWGDAGDSMEKRSWLFWGNNKLKLLSEKTERTDHRAYAEDENDTIVETWNDLYLIDFKNSIFDTLNTSEKRIRSKYYKLLNKASY